MSNADKFKNIFGLYATELWSMPEKDFLKWLNSEAMNCSEIPNNSDTIYRQDAIDALNYCQTYLFDSLDDDKKISLEDAEYAIEQLSSAQPDNQINLCDSCDYSYPDCSSKNDDVIFGNGIGNDNICACNKYKPSAQPEKRTEERTETHACDLIDRQAAIDALDKRFDNIPIEQTAEILMLRRDLRALPSAQPTQTNAESNTESTQDCISRRKVYDAVDCMRFASDAERQYGFSLLEQIPTAEPERKTGTWIFVHPLQKDDSGAYMCSCCKNGDWDIKLTDKFCKFCGARMMKEGEEHD